MITLTTLSATAAATVSSGMGYIMIKASKSFGSEVICTVSTRSLDALACIHKVAIKPEQRGTADYSMKAVPVDLLDALTKIGFLVTSTCADSDHFIWTLMKK